MELSRFVRILADGQRRGTGYLLHSRRVLTARHVVAEAKTLAIHYSNGSERAKSDEVEICWQGEGDLDAAVLGVATDLRLELAVLDAAPPPGDRPWRSRGWSAAARAKDATGMSGLSGTAYEFEPGSTRLEVTVDAPPAEGESWRGISGAPVFIGQRLIGVLGEASRDFSGGRLWAVAVAALLKDSDFRRAVLAGLDRETRQRDLVEDLAAILRKNPAAKRAVAAELGLADDPQAEELAEALCRASSWRDVVAAFDQAHGELCRRGEAQAGAVVEILDRVLPEIYALTELQAWPGGEGGQLIALPIETKTLAEIAVAAFDRRRLAFEEVRDHRAYPAGKALVPLDGDRSEKGFDFGQEEGFREWILRLAQWLIAEEDFHELQKRERFEEMLPLLNLQIEQDIRRGEPRRYFLYSPEFAADHRDFLAQLREKLSALHLVEATERTRFEERRASAPLQSLLFRSFQLRNPTP